MYTSVSFLFSHVLLSLPLPTTPTLPAFAPSKNHWLSTVHPVLLSFCGYTQDNAMVSPGSPNAVQQQLARLRRELEGVPYLQRLENVSSVPKEYLALGAALLVLVFLYTGLMASLTCTVIGVVYPTYASFKAIETTRKDDDTQWLTYWTIFGVFSTLEHFSQIIVKWMPFFYIMKAVFLVYLMYPGTRGAVVLYQKFLQPLLSKHVETPVDRAFRATRAGVDEVEEKVRKYTDEARDYVNKERMD